MDNIPLEAQLVIDKLVEFWRTRLESSDLITHIDRVSWGNSTAARFFRHVYEDLRADERSYYPVSSAREFKRFLEVEYRLLPEPTAEERKEYERKTREEREENARKTRADFDALGKEIAKATSRAELVELGRKREKLAPYTGSEYPYQNICWCCHNGISSAIHARCPYYRWYICGNCGSCEPHCNKTYKSVVRDEAVDSFLPDFPDDF